MGADPDGAAVSGKRAGNSRGTFLPLETERADPNTKRRNGADPDAGSGLLDSGGFGG